VAPSALIDLYVGIAIVLWMTSLDHDDAHPVLTIFS
jgi:hypothetical protein